MLKAYLSTMLTSCVVPQRIGEWIRVAVLCHRAPKGPRSKPRRRLSIRGLSCSGRLSTVSPARWTWCRPLGSRRPVQPTSGPIPPPLRDSPKCPRYSLVSICLPDETKFLEQPEPGSGTLRRLIAPNSDRRSLYFNTPGVSVGKSKVFFEAYESRMNSVVTHPVFDYKVGYRRALELQPRMIAKVITGEIAIYHPLQTR